MEIHGAKVYLYYQYHYFAATEVRKNAVIHNSKIQLSVLLLTGLTKLTAKPPLPALAVRPTR